MAEFRLKDLAESLRPAHLVRVPKVKPTAKAKPPAAPRKRGKRG